MRVLVIALVAAWAAAAQQQPLPFSHKIHAGAIKLKCSLCHANPDPGETMGIAAASVCAQCHPAMKKNSPAVKWVRVYQIPSYVIFSHRTHLEARTTCKDCHGPVEEREQLAREGDITMGGCMNCHRARKVSNDCVFCHERLQ